MHETEKAEKPWLLQAVFDIRNRLKFKKAEEETKGFKCIYNYFHKLDIVCIFALGHVKKNNFKFDQFALLP